MPPILPYGEIRRNRRIDETKVTLMRVRWKSVAGRRRRWRENTARMCGVMIWLWMMYDARCMCVCVQYDVEQTTPGRLYTEHCDLHVSHETLAHRNSSTSDDISEHRLGHVTRSLSISDLYRILASGGCAAITGGCIEDVRLVTLND